MLEMVLRRNYTIRRRKLPSKRTGSPNARREYYPKRTLKRHKRNKKKAPKRKQQEFQPIHPDKTLDTKKWKTITKN